MNFTGEHKLFETVSKETAVDEETEVQGVS
jgi:hypothetical protein